MAVEEEKDSLEVLHAQQQATLTTLRANLHEERTCMPNTTLSSSLLWFVASIHSLHVFYKWRLLIIHVLMYITVLKEKVTALQKLEKEPSLKLIEMEKTILSLRTKNTKLSSECR